MRMIRLLALMSTTWVMCAAALAQTAYMGAGAQPAAEELPAAGGNSLWWLVTSGALVLLAGILMTILWRWVDRLEKRMEKTEDAITKHETRLTLVEKESADRAVACDKRHSVPTVPVDSFNALCERVTELLDGMHEIREWIAEMRGAAGGGFGKPITNPGGRR